MSKVTDTARRSMGKGTRLAPPVSDSEQRYRDGNYLRSTGGTWHLEDSPFKAAQVLRMMREKSLQVRTICEIGCGAGGILAALQSHLDDSVQFTGFDISPQAYEMSKTFCRDNLSFKLGDAFESEDVFDLVLVIDVVEHVEDYLDFLRKAKGKGKYKIFHIPLEIHCSGILRDRLTYSWRKVGHIHPFSLSTALESLRFTGHDVVDYFLTRTAFESGTTLTRTRVMNTFRRMLPTRICARLLGGYSLLVLAR